jgi:hypothetical protein
MTGAEKDGRSIESAANENPQPAAFKLAELVAATMRKQQDLMDEAIARLYRI